ncbi:hypothetical protein [Aquimarina spongiae]|uniref:Uncharacterized protein n=1 Tax=Aquimarina spongiae TaxID=570521 RepID=A0A1M6KUB7_9FLAO|nr:hypothetical protein [Aquimarina spongiae]SHJ62567.1 hypothetical protein SAMN04488508_11272 [Aquimarina spongiae]
MAFPKITLDNTLSEEVIVYDAFQNNQDDQSLSNFFGALTDLTSASSGTSEVFEPIHGPISTYIIYDSNHNPIKRVFTMGNAPQTFTVDQGDVAIMTQTQSFITLLEKSPNDPQCVAFQKLIKGGKAKPNEVNTFFKGTKDYTSCTFISYMLATVTIARTPETKNKPPQEQEYSLSSLCKYMGIDWPSGFPDVVISDFFCSEADEILRLGGKLNIHNVTFQEGVLDHVLSFLPSPEITFDIEVVLKPGFSMGVICLKFMLDDIKIPIGNGKTFDIDQPTLMLTINPLFKFVVFEIKATIPFSIFKSPTFDAQIAMTIDNIEAEVGVELTGNKTSLLTPPIIKGLHFDSFGVGIGLIFEPAGFAIGVDGTFHIGDQKDRIKLDDEQFAIVCEMEEEVPNPLYLAFYVPKLDFDEIITIFTNTSYNFDVPVTFSDLSFRWAENPMEPVVLPDGSLAPMGYGFNAYMDILGLTFYGALEIDMAHGVSGDITMSPLAMGKLFKLSGDGKGVTIKVDANGNPIPNNTIPKTAAEKKVIENATTKQLVAPGGPEMTVSTSSSPYFTLGAQVSLFDIIKEKIAASISKKGIAFELDYGAILQTKMKCILQNYHNFSGDFSYGLDVNVPFPTIAGFSLGTLKVNADCNMGLAIATSTSDIDFKVHGGFNFEGLNLRFGPFDADINISRIKDLLAVVEHYILDNAEAIFKEIIQDASKWASFVKKAFISGVHDVAQGLKTAFKKSEQEVASIMHGAGYGMNEVASGLKTAFGAPATVVADALKTAFGASDKQVASALKVVGFGAKETAQALQSAFGIAPKVINDIMQGAGYSANQIKDAFESLGGKFASAAKDIWHAVSHWDHW